MHLPIEQPFLQFRREGTPAALAEVFDRSAPELMRVACHVAGDLAAAEDLVQSTFLTAIESAARFDERRALLPWLLGILANHARAARRAGARTPDLRVLPRLESSPLRDVQGRELDALVQRELDRLQEPYREVAILSLRHDLKPQQIAHALGRSPGAVRVQLHRALEAMRQRIPRSAALPALFAPSFGHGLATVRAVVLKSAVKAAAAVAVVSAGSILVTKKAVAAALLAFATAGVVWKSWPDEFAVAGAPAAEVRDAASDRSRLPAADSAVESEVPSTAPVAPESPDRTEMKEADPPRLEAKVALEGEVLDGETLKPVAGASVEFFEPLRMRLSEVKRRFADFSSRTGWDGSVRFAVACPCLVEPLPEGAWRDAVDVEVCAAPDADRAPYSSERTSSEGRFRLVAPKVGGVVVVTHPDYERQVVPVVADDAPLSIALLAAREVRGFVVDKRGKPIGTPLKLLFRANEQRGTATERTQHWTKQLGPWLVETEADGTFRFQAGAEFLGASSASVGYEVTLTGHRKSPGDPIRVEVRRKPVLTVLDAATKEPVEDFSLLAISVQSGSPTYGGRFHARDGRLELESGPRADYGGRAFNPMEDPAWLEIWSDRHAPKRIELPDSAEREDLTVELDEGEALRLVGRLLHAGAPLESTTISLNAYYLLGWDEGSLRRIDEAVTSKDGSFALEGPAGKYVVLLRIGEKPLMRLVDLPANGPFELDVARGGRIEAVVRDARGTPRRDAKVFIRCPGDRQEFAFTDEGGVARFDSLVAGSYQVSLNGTRETHISIAQDQAEATVADEGTITVALTAPPAGPVHLRIHASGTTDYTGWRARDATYFGREWTKLSTEGVIGENAVNFTFLEVAAADSSKWRLEITPQILAEGVVEVPVSDVGYRGRVVDRATGSPLAGATVNASRRGASESFSARTDAEGRFSLRNLEPEVHVLNVHRPRKGSRIVLAEDDDPGGSNAWFTPAQPAAPGGREVTLRVPDVSGSTMAGQGRRTLHGRITREPGGAPVARALIYFQSKFADDDGEWGISVEGSMGRSGVDGRFELVAARAPAYEFSVYENVGTGSRALVRERWVDDGRAEESIERDVVVE